MFSNIERIQNTRGGSCKKLMNRTSLLHVGLDYRLGMLY